MRIAYLCKRQYMNHDVIVDRYARLYEQPYQLARLGHEVLGLCLSYRPTDERDEHHEASPGTLHWVGLAPGNGLVIRGARLLGFPARALGVIREFKPDILVGASDCPHIILGSWLAKKLGIPFTADLYDHFESFGLSQLPGIAPLYKRALRDAAAVSCVSDPLAELVRNGYKAKGKVFCLPSTINKEIFFECDKAACRSALGLPRDAKLIGTAGGLSEDKGIAPLYRAFEKLATQDIDVHLALAGKLDPRCPPPENERVHFLGMLSHNDTAVLFNALDVGVVYVRDTPYGRYSFPQKAYEMAACGIPMVVARIGAMEALFKHIPDSLYEAGNPDDLCNALKSQLDHQSRAKLSIPTWEEQAVQLAEVFEQLH